MSAVPKEFDPEVILANSALLAVPLWHSLAKRRSVCFYCGVSIVTLAMPLMGKWDKKAR